MVGVSRSGIGVMVSKEVWKGPWEHVRGQHFGANNYGRVGCRGGEGGLDYGGWGCNCTICKGGHGGDEVQP